MKLKMLVFALKSKFNKTKEPEEAVEYEEITIEIK